MDGLLWFLRRHGPIKSGMLAANHMAQSLYRQVYVHERHMWYALWTRLVTLMPLAGGLMLAQGAAADIELLSAANLCGRTTARKYFAHGANLWMVKDGERAAFCCWIFPTHMPVVTARARWQPLPPHTVCLEDSMTSPLYRGKGIAPAAWSLIAQHLRKTVCGPSSRKSKKPIRLQGALC